MAKWLLIRMQHHNENTAEYGFGDYPEWIDYIAAVIEADTLRKAQNEAKKQFPSVKFGGLFGAHMVASTDENVRSYLDAADSRLTRDAVHSHRASLEALGLPPYGSKAIKEALKTWSPNQ